MSDLKEFQSLWSGMDLTLKKYIAEVKELRASVPDSDEHESLSRVSERLAAARRAQDRTEALLANAGQICSRLRKLVRELEDAYDDKWRTAVEENRTGEYMSGKAQDALYQTKALSELVKVRQGKSMLADAEEAYEVIRLHYYGLNNVRKDADTFIRAISLASTLG